MHGVIPMKRESLGKGSCRERERPADLDDVDRLDEVIEVFDGTDVLATRQLAASHGGSQRRSGFRIRRR